MDGKMFARLGAVVFVAVAITATVVEMNRQDETSANPAAAVVAPAAPDPLRAELIRCQLLGEGGPRDGACLRAWAENRRRFLAPGARPAERLPDVPTALPTGNAADAIDGGTDEAVRKDTAPIIDTPLAPVGER